MKTLILKSVMLLFVMATISSCSNDDDKGGNINANGFTFQEQSHPTEAAFYLETSGNTSISLTADNAEDNQILFLFNQTDYADISGNYTYKSYEDEDFNPEVNFGDITFYLGDEIYQDFTQGNLSISKSAGKIVIEYSFSGPSGSVEGSYNGSI